MYVFTYYLLIDLYLCLFHFSAYVTSQRGKCPGILKVKELHNYRNGNKSCDEGKGNKCGLEREEYMDGMVLPLVIAFISVISWKKVQLECTLILTYRNHMFKAFKNKGSYPGMNRRQHA